MSQNPQKGMKENQKNIKKNIKKKREKTKKTNEKSLETQSKKSGKKQTELLPKTGKKLRFTRQMSLRTELILWSVGILLVFMGTQIIFTRYTAESLAIWQKELQIQRLMSRLKESYTDDKMDIYSMVEEAQELENLKIMIFGEERVIYHSSSVENAPPRSNLQIENPKTNRPSSAGVGGQMGVISPSGGLLNSTDFREVEGRVVSLEESFDFNGDPRTVLIWSSAEAIQSAVTLFIHVNLAVSLVVILFVVLGVIFFSRRFIKPITEVENVADSVANMDFSLKANENVRTRELIHLAQSINVMSDNLEEMIGELHQDKEDLTMKVENHEKLEQMRRQFVANISHEMKTPLSMLMMYSENLKLDLPNMDKTFYYDTIIEEAAGLNAMVEQLLDTSAMENGLATASLEPMDFSSFLEQCLARHQVLWDGYQVTVDISPNIHILGDEKYLEQAVRNYITNAISHTKIGDKIEISLKILENKAVYSVENQGEPIPEKDLPYLWDSFYRADKSRTQIGKEKRVGLGLYIVKTCISSHFGEVLAENVGQGAKFSFSIPLMSE